jgi:3-dehydroquinate dehydratase type I
VLVGKSTLAFIAAQALGSELIETRQLPASHRKQDRLDRDQSASEVPDEDARPSLGSILSDYRRGNILVIDSDELYSTDSRIALGHFAQTVGPVIHVTREKDKVLEYLEQQEDIQNQDIQRIKDEWDATESMLLELCSYSFVSLFCSSDTSSNDHGKQQSSRKDDVQSSTKGITHKRLLGPHLKPLERDFIRLLRFIHGVYTNHVPITSNRSYLLSLTYGHVSQLIPHIEELAIGIDCWELRVDLLAHNDPISLAQQISLLRRHSDLPIYFTMRTRSQAGMMPEFKDEPSLAGYQRAVLSLAVKMGLEYVDISLASPYDNITNIVRNKGNSQIVMSWHDLAGRVGWSGPEPRSIIDYACREGADVVMMIGFARDFQDNLSLRAFVEEVQSRRIPIIALNAGTQVSTA